MELDASFSPLVRGKNIINTPWETKEREPEKGPVLASAKLRGFTTRLNHAVLAPETRQQRGQAPSPASLGIPAGKGTRSHWVLWEWQVLDTDGGAEEAGHKESCYCTFQW